MASKIKAVNTYRPKLDLGPTVSPEKLAEFLARRTRLNPSEVTYVLTELHEAIIFFNQQNQGVKIEGLGTYLPKIGLDGKLDVEHRLDRRIRQKLNEPDAFHGRIVNKRNIGKSAAELVALWNEEHPEDPVR